MYYSQKQIDRANQVNLVDFLKRMGEEVIQSGSEYRWKKHDSVTLRENTYFRHSTANGGHPVDFVMKFYQVPFPEAVRMLIQEEPEARSNFFLHLRAIQVTISCDTCHGIEGFPRI